MKVEITQEARKFLKKQKAVSVVVDMIPNETSPG